MPLARRPSRAPIAPAIVISHDDLVIMLLIELLRWLHVIGAAVLLGTGAPASPSRDLLVHAREARLHLVLSAA